MRSVLISAAYIRVCCASCIDVVVDVQACTQPGAKSLRLGTGNEHLTSNQYHSASHASAALWCSLCSVVLSLTSIDMYWSN